VADETSRTSLCALFEGGVHLTGAFFRLAERAPHLADPQGTTIGAMEPLRSLGWSRQKLLISRGTVRRHRQARFFGHRDHELCLGFSALRNGTPEGAGGGRRPSDSLTRGTTIGAMERFWSLGWCPEKRLTSQGNFA
jgi:hypothetical protein